MRHPEGPRFLQRAEGSPADLPLKACTHCLQSLAKSSQSGFIDLMSFILLAPPPAFDFLFATDGGVGIEEAFVIDEAGEVVAAGESGDEFLLVLPDAVREIARHAYV